MRIVGRGAFGKVRANVYDEWKVRIVEHRETRQLYALKYINKEECIRMDAARNIIRERTILEQLDHPFLCRLRFAFQDNEYIYMVTDLMLGGDLYYHISRQHFSEDVLRFWFAELASAIKYLHCKRVVHRDIKPQNILLDEEGHVHITDFNIATYLHSRRVLTSNSGTGYYMAPEVYKGTGYDEAVDWWSLGVTLYECIYKKRPFECATSEELKALVRRGCIHYPDDVQVSGECLAAIQGFLEMSPSRRLGHGDAGWVALIRHPFFRSIDWRSLETKSLKPPFRPSSDRNNFDPTFDLEELILGDSSVSIHARRQAKISKGAKPGDETLTKRDRDLQMIEEKFTPFDFTVFEKYEGFKDPIRMTVGDPPDWVKPAFEGAEQGDLLPVKRISTTAPNEWQHEEDTLMNNPITPVIPSPVSLHHDQLPPPQHRWMGPDEETNNPSVHRSPSRSASTSNLAARAGQDAENIPWKRRSVGMVRAKQQHLTSEAADGSSISLSEEYAMSLHGLRKKQSTKSFRERRERDRKSINNDGLHGKLAVDATEPLERQH